MIVHILHHGLPRCGFSDKVPMDWPTGHRWVPEGFNWWARLNREDTACQGCKDYKKGPRQGMLDLDYDPGSDFYVPKD